MISVGYLDLARDVEATTPAQLDARTPSMWCCYRAGAPCAQGGAGVCVQVLLRIRLTSSTRVGSADPDGAGRARRERRGKARQHKRRGGRGARVTWPRRDATSARTHGDSAPRKPKGTEGGREGGREPSSLPTRPITTPQQQIQMCVCALLI